MRTIGAPREVKHTVFNNRVYYKPALHKPVIRTVDVNRVSGKVIERNKLFKEKMPGVVVSCRGRPWPEFVACLKSGAAAAGLGTGESKTPAYRQRFWKRK